MDYWPLTQNGDVITDSTPISPLGAIRDEAEGERLIARFRGHARRLGWSAIILIGTVGATAYFLGNLPEPFKDWMLIAAAGILLLFGVVVPFFYWMSRAYAITTQRVIKSTGVGTRNRVEMSHSRGYIISVRRGILQRLWGAGTITLSDGRGSELRLENIPDVVLVHEALADQLEISQILAHREARASQFNTDEAF